MKINEKACSNSFDRILCGLTKKTGVIFNSQQQNMIVSNGAISYRIHAGTHAFRPFNLNGFQFRFYCIYNIPGFVENDTLRTAESSKSTQHVRLHI